MTLLVVGLGNPGPKFAKSRHNLGFMALDALHDRFAFPRWVSRFHGLFSKGGIDGRTVMLLKPQTYMNRSGVALAECKRFYKLGGKDILVVYDDLDLEPGRLRIRHKGGTGGHKGLESIRALAGPEFVRLKLGIGHPGSRTKVNSWVLTPFSAGESEKVAAFLQKLAEEFPNYVGDAPDRFASRVMQEQAKS